MAIAGGILTVVNNSMTEAIATAILGVDTLWGGDVMCPSGTGRFIADSWFSDEPLPRAYTIPEAAALRASGGVSAKAPDLAAVDAYLSRVDIPSAIAAAKSCPGEYLAGLALCFETMWDLAMERIGRGSPVPYQRCVMASTGAPPEPSDPAPKRDRVAELLGATPDRLLDAVDAWRRERIVPAASIHQLPNEARVDDGRASDDSLDDIDELVDGRDSALEKVTNPLATREQLDCVLDLNVRRDDQDGCVGELAPGVLSR